jgi:hypothetical protein
MCENLHIKKIGDFKQECYWSSTEQKTDDEVLKGTSAWTFDFQNGIACCDENGFKDLTYKVRAVRAF